MLLVSSFRLLKCWSPPGSSVAIVNKTINRLIYREGPSTLAQSRFWNSIGTRAYRFKFQRTKVRVAKPAKMVHSSEGGRGSPWKPNRLIEMRLHSRSNGTSSDAWCNGESKQDWGGRHQMERGVKNSECPVLQCTYRKCTRIWGFSLLFYILIVPHAGGSGPVLVLNGTQAYWT